MKAFSFDNISEAGEFHRYRPVNATHAARVRGPFTVSAASGHIPCDDGYLVVDGDNLRPVSRAVFDAHFEIDE